ncbi:MULTISPECIES: L-seryl-tRNA(Sec) selenium transferase [Bosea]|uniref:L-seryl-tRNA(Sec) selenium transferase n=1 Tax=Bosea TaxID=85413 RepID=UPI00215017F6|nr:MULTISPECIES: L-seryl-tRNA(Sec) selenium transferase [Bosea]MCR4522622.1 L-seryl-tRNA(Sec) selenium transferase [Bosea sp. 47.2.35]MDR6827129.1 L-seryl-tRNA(Ser) seleniumtransferase [Bosea robiniae]MDR6893839.1 L-seryl-tRNA(Ser) seleniumtransferase [Bosea sp. BE109]MDR7136461.1 L-seryl-tRNA(Ser) seleniumtransferase [Bosea sp. BE168]MDR7173160.1 L-seryl-tRNA(Ser) seleniumtransferase [Bosea sp. BE271]
MNKPERFRPPSVDTVLRSANGELAIARHGRTAATDAIRQAIERLRAGGQPAAASVEQVGRMALDRLEERERPSQRPLINLTGTVLHTNLGRALLAEEAIEAVVAAMRAPTNLEYEIEAGQRGERDAHVRDLVRELTGAEDAILVNNNASGVLLVLNTLARGREAIVSRGELIEIGGAFRMPDIMARAGASLREIGTTNRTHLKDYAEAIGPETGLLMKVHTSNYVVQGFTAEVEPAELAKLARQHELPFVDDLGSGTLIDLSRWGLRKEKTVQDALKGGADLVTFSGDKLLGGPQAGIVAGRKDLIAKLVKNPLKRALRLDKLRLAALEATLRLYRDPDRLAQRLPTLRLFTRTADDLRALAERLQPQVAAALGPDWVVEIIDCASQIGSGALPLETLPSAGLALRPAGKATGSAVEKLAAAFRAVQVPMIGRIAQGALVFDLRCLEDEALFAAQLDALKPERPDALA